MNTKLRYIRKRLQELAEDLTIPPDIAGKEVHFQLGYALQTVESASKEVAFIISRIDEIEEGD